jgi:hypothetical protein
MCRGFCFVSYWYVEEGGGSAYVTYSISLEAIFVMFLFNRRSIEKSSMICELKRVGCLSHKKSTECGEVRGSTLHIRGWLSMGLWC